MQKTSGERPISSKPENMIIVIDVCRTSKKKVDEKEERGPGL
jgi:hypothetical protein